MLRPLPARCMMQRMSYREAPSSPILADCLSRDAGAAFVALVQLLASAGSVFVLNDQSEIVYCSPGVAENLGYPGDVWVGESAPAIARMLHAPLLFETSGLAERHFTLTTQQGELRQVRRLMQAVTVDGESRGLRVFLLLWEPQDRAVGTPLSAAIQGSQPVEFHGLLSRDPIMKEAFNIIRNVAATDSTVLVRGESGTGKEIVARALHTLSERRKGPFLAINCATLTPSLLESELFGHVRGAFTGAVKDHTGLFKRADGGTVFLDEIAELPLDLQAKLLRVLQERAFIPVGGDRPVTVDVRIVSATHRALREEVKAGRFRDDLMYRLRVVPIFLPPLRERRGDVNLLLRHFIDKHNAVGLRHVERIAPEAMRKLLDHGWPGNVRELQNVVEYAFAVGRGPELSVDELPPEFREPARYAIVPAAEPEADLSERNRIVQVLAVCHGNLEAASKRLGMNRSTLWRKRKKYGL